MNLMWYEKFGFHGYSSDWKFDITKQGQTGQSTKEKWRHTTTSNYNFYKFFGSN